MKWLELIKTVRNWATNIVTTKPRAKRSFIFETDLDEASIAEWDPSTKQDPFTRWGWKNRNDKQIWDTVELEPEFKKEVDRVNEAYCRWLMAMDENTAALENLHRLRRKSNDAYMHATQVFDEFLDRHREMREVAFAKLGEGDRHLYEQWAKQFLQVRYIEAEVQERISAMNYSVRD